MDINGKDLIDLGFKEGKLIGEILEYLLEKKLWKIQNLMIKRF